MKWRWRWWALIFFFAFLTSYHYHTKIRYHELIQNNNLRSTVQKHKIHAQTVYKCNSGPLYSYVTWVFGYIPETNVPPHAIQTSPNKNKRRIKTEKTEERKSSSITDTIALSNRTNLVFHKPFLRMVCMEPMVTVDTKHNEPPHQIGLCRFALFLSSVSSNTSPRHRIRGAQPETANSTSGHMATTPRTHRPRHGRRS